jgi:hypothetical protein
MLMDYVRSYSSGSIVTASLADGFSMHFNPLRFKSVPDAYRSDILQKYLIYIVPSFLIFFTGILNMLHILSLQLFASLTDFDYTPHQKTSNCQNATSHNCFEFAHISAWFGRGQCTRHLPELLKMPNLNTLRIPRGSIS